MNEIKPIIFNPIEHRSHKDLRISQAEAFDFTQHKIHLITDLEHRGEVGKMFLGGFFLPACGIYKALDELVLPGDEIHHSALRMPDQRNAADSADSDRIGDLKFAVPQVRSAGSKYEREIVRNM